MQWFLYTHTHTRYYNDVFALRVGKIGFRRSLSLLSLRGDTRSICGSRWAFATRLKSDFVPTERSNAAHGRIVRTHTIVRYNKGWRFSLRECSYQRPPQSVPTDSVSVRVVGGGGTENRIGSNFHWNIKPSRTSYLCSDAYIRFIPTAWSNTRSNARGYRMAAVVFYSMFCDWKHVVCSRYNVDFRYFMLAVVCLNNTASIRSSESIRHDFTFHLHENLRYIIWLSSFSSVILVRFGLFIVECFDTTLY